jgi:hypothetical protein
MSIGVTANAADVDAPLRQIVEEVRLAPDAMKF